MNPRRAPQEIGYAYPPNQGTDLRVYRWPDPRDKRSERTVGLRELRAKAQLPLTAHSRDEHAVHKYIVHAEFLRKAAIEMNRVVVT